MTITYDPLANAVYIKLGDAKVHKTVEFAPEIFIDLDRDKKILGVELLRPGRIIVRKQMNKIANTYHIPSLKKFHPGTMQRVYR